MPKGGYRPGGGSKPGVPRGKYKIKSTIRKEFEALDISHLGPKFIQVLEKALDDPDVRVQRWAFEQMRQYLFVPQTPNQGGPTSGLILNLTMPVKDSLEQSQAIEAVAEVVKDALELPPPPAPVEAPRPEQPKLPEGVEIAPVLGDPIPPGAQMLRKPTPIEIAQMTEEQYAAYLDSLQSEKKASVKAF